MDKKGNNAYESEEEDPEIISAAGGASSRQHIQVVVMDPSHFHSTNRPAPKGPDTFNKALRFCRFFFQAGLFMALGLCAVIMSQQKPCPGTTGLLTFIWGVGILLMYQSLMYVAYYFYFENHQNDHAGQFFGICGGLSQLTACALCIYGTWEVWLQTVNHGIQSELDSNNETGQAAQYSCDSQVFEVSIVSVIIGFIYCASLIYKFCNWYRLSSTSANGGTNDVSL
ncbi:MAG: hypothetical protein Sylvanvirus12_3 [Sylvanvirus sp.]|uniref:Uncharacterized protein n=1 Tax=Sylvanvirus sp. TaxID=2487774 RepID=A0A3G5AJU2_9VIRU|nr:MAG: hypothetical protein Sylvanvirus12_3 [Sylvanvirus sp.]